MDWKKFEEAAEVSFLVAVFFIMVLAITPTV